MRHLIPNFQTFRASLLHDSYVFDVSPLSCAFYSISKRVFTASSPRWTFESRRFFFFASSASRSLFAYSIGVVWGTPRVRPDLLAAEVTVPIALTGVVRYSDVIFIEFSIYLRSMSSPFGPCALSCFLYFYTINTLKIVKSQAPLNVLSTRVLRTKNDRNRNISSSTTS